MDENTSKKQKRNADLKELVILSGKGGTGKTTLTASFAALAKQAVLADCDVDAADLHLITDPNILRTEPFFSGKEAIVDRQQCTGCGLCTEACRFYAFRTESDGTFSINPIHCEGCGLCVRLCPEQTIRFEDRNCGSWMISSTRFGPMVHAQLHAAGENSGKLVTVVRKEAKKIAVAEHKSLLLVDGPPGIGCAVISSVTGADGVLLVTEPSLSGLHDVKRVSALAKSFAIPVSVCVNKSDIDQRITEEIRAQTEEDGNYFAGTIAYDEQMVQAQLRGLSAIEFVTGDTRERIEQIWENVWTRL
jgi:MinD superfamily P-loop ATPase